MSRGDNNTVPGVAREPYKPYDPAASADRRANWPRSLATALDRPQPTRWNGVDRELER